MQLLFRSSFHFLRYWLFLSYWILEYPLSKFFRFIKNYGSLLALFKISAKTKSALKGSTGTFTCLRWFSSSMSDSEKDSILDTSYILDLGGFVVIFPFLFSSTAFLEVVFLRGLCSNDSSESCSSEFRLRGGLPLFEVFLGSIFWNYSITWGGNKSLIDIIFFLIE